MNWNARTLDVESVRTRTIVYSICLLPITTITTINIRRGDDDLGYTKLSILISLMQSMRYSVIFGGCQILVTMRLQPQQGYSVHLQCFNHKFKTPPAQTRDIIHLILQTRYLF